MKFGRVLATLAAALTVAAPAFAAETIKVGGLWDLTGVTADVGKPFADGVQDAIASINEKGGINGKKIELINVDYAYKIPQATATYKKFVESDKVVMINGWGTGDTEALKDIIAKDKIPYFSASFSGHLTDPTKTPYNFFVGASYSDQIRGFLDYVKKNWKGKGAAKVAFIYPNHGFGKAPIEAGRQYAKELGIELVHEEIIPAPVQDVTSNLLSMQKKNPDYAYVQTTVAPCANLLKDAKKLGIKTIFFLGNYGMTEELPKLAGDAADRRASGRSEGLSAETRGRRAADQGHGPPERHKDLGGCTYLCKQPQPLRCFFGMAPAEQEGDEKPCSVRRAQQQLAF